MSVIAALPHLDVDLHLNRVLTFIVPSPGGCDLACPFCFIKKRQENATDFTITPGEYTRFIREVARKDAVSNICVQGYEPLLDKSFFYTNAILSAGQNLGISTSLVTNGTHLLSRLNALAMLEPDKIAVSLDAATSFPHDRQRGKIGSWEKTVLGIRASVNKLSSKTDIVVTSVFIPKKRKQLEGMPELLHGIGIKRWSISPLQIFPKNNEGNTTDNIKELFYDLIYLKNICDHFDIDFTVEDEFGFLKEKIEKQLMIDINILNVRHLLRKSEVFRLLPTGHCSTGTSILEKMNAGTPKWTPNRIDAGEFVRMIRKRPSTKKRRSRLHMLHKTLPTPQSVIQWRGMGQN